ncbi:protein max [Halyomorpha halys]|uniref:protein max n=1 Tax=Halyomorpha halys TaxID=286706 RepID=UPI0006D4DCA6|nr:protein max-like [Halyomorpha halys]
MSDDDVENAEKRAHHNALERKRRDHIKDSFNSLRDAVPSLQGEKSVSRAQILKRAADYIQQMRKKNNTHQQDIADLKRQNSLLEAQIKTLERSRSVVMVQQPNPERYGQEYGLDSMSDSSDSDTSDGSEHRNKKLKMNEPC